MESIFVCVHFPELKIKQFRHWMPVKTKMSILVIRESERVNETFIRVVIKLSCMLYKLCNTYMEYCMNHECR